MALGLALMGFAQYPLLRFGLGLDSQIGIPASTVVMFMIGGLMCALTAMILLVKRQTANIQSFPAKPASLDSEDRYAALKLHAAGLLIFTGIPLLNFLASYHLWLKAKSKSPALFWQSTEVLNFQLSWYLYLLISLFLTLVVIGFITTPLLLLVHLLVSLLACAVSLSGKAFSYPGNIPIIQGRLG